jgi:hypothetical protein
MERKDRDRAKQAKAAAKLEKRQAKGPSGDGGSTTESVEPGTNQEAESPDSKAS